MAQLYLYYEDGTREMIVTDSACRCHAGPLLMADLYDGETYDARLEIDDWSLPTAGDAAWLPVEGRAVDVYKRQPYKRPACRCRK